MKQEKILMLKYRKSCVWHSWANRALAKPNDLIFIFYTLMVEADNRLPQVV